MQEQEAIAPFLEEALSVDEDLSVEVTVIDLGLTQATRSITDARQALEDTIKEVQMLESTMQNLISKRQQIRGETQIPQESHGTIRGLAAVASI